MLGPKTPMKGTAGHVVAMANAPHISGTRIVDGHEVRPKFFLSILGGYSVGMASWARLTPSTTHAREARIDAPCRSRVDSCELS
jgi:hypothetical protein